MKYMKWTDLNIGDKVIIRQEILDDWGVRDKFLQRKLFGKVLIITMFEENDYWLRVGLDHDISFNIYKDTGTSCANPHSINKPLFELVELGKE